jgi:hypothetical protein
LVCGAGKNGLKKRTTKNKRTETKKTMMKKNLFAQGALLFALSTINSQLSTLHAQSTAFSVQGKLNANGAAANGTYDLRLAVFDATGNPVSATNIVSGVRFTNGVFSVTPDFGASVFNGQDRFLEIAVGNGGASSFTTIGRQPILPTPYSTYAHKTETVAPGAVVTSLNGLKDDVVLHGDSTVTVTANNDNSLTIHANGGGDGLWSLNGSTASHNGPVEIDVASSDTPSLTLANGIGNFPGDEPYGLYHTDGYVTLASQLYGDPSQYGDYSEAYFGTITPHPFNLMAGNRTAMTVDTAGNVGIGTTPQAKFHLYDPASVSHRIQTGGGVNAWTRLEFANGNGQWNVGTSKSFNGDQFYFHRQGASSMAFSIQPNGDGFFGGKVSVNSLTIRGGSDLAEPFPIREESLEKGSVVVIDKEHPGQVAQSTRAYDTRVAGIVSGANGINPGIALKQEGVLDRGQNVALTGRVYVQADASYGAIEPGDLLTTSDTPGHAMKVSDHARAQGAILGKAMSALAEGKGMVFVLVTLQ